MPSSPLDVKANEASDPSSVFRRGLEQLDALIDSGVSLSGHEPNCAFLNVPGPKGRRFATASTVFGLDYPDDARAPALVDWDRDGDLDLWCTNRTAPMLRYLRNDMSSSQWLAIKLRGVTCNRDAIGARVEVTAEGLPKQSRTVKAGEGFLGQSSLWCQFGLADCRAIREVKVRWPGGAEEKFTDLEPGQRWLLIQGKGRAEHETLAEATSLPKAEQASVAESSAVQALSPSLWPMPALPFTTFDGKDTEVRPDGKTATLVNLWATWCAPCVAELKDFAQAKDRLNKAGLRVVALSVDGLGPSQGAASTEKPGGFFQRLGSPFLGGQATTESLARLESMYARLFGPRWPLPVPTSVLLNERGELAAFYKGAVSVERVLADLKAAKRGGEAMHDASLPFPGRWFQRPRPQSPTILALDLMERDQVDGARELIQRPDARLRKSKDYAKLQTWIGDSLSAQKRYKEALAAYSAAVEAEPENVAALNNLAWQLATNAEPENRDALAAIRYAERAAKLTKNADASVLDTLAAAHAQAGHFPQAITLAEKALSLARENQPDLVAPLEKALARYRAKRPNAD